MLCDNIPDAVYCDLGIFFHSIPRRTPAHGREPRVQGRPGHRDRAQAGSGHAPRSTCDRRGPPVRSPGGRAALAPRFARPSAPPIGFPAMRPEDVRTIGVVGCGIMGSGIVEVCAKAGFVVITVEVNDEAMARGRRRVETSMARAVERGKMDSAAHDAALARITSSTSLDDLSDADL